MASKQWPLLPLTVTILVSLAAGYVLTGTPLTVTVDGLPFALRTHRTTVGDVLAELGVVLAEGDTVTPGPSVAVTPDTAIHIARAQSVTIQADGQVQRLSTQTKDLTDILREARIRLHPRDLVSVNGQAHAPPAAALGARPVSGVAHLASLAVASMDASVPLVRSQDSRINVLQALAQRPPAITISIRRAIPFYVIEDGISAPLMAAADTVGEALFREGIYVFAADRVVPPLDTALSAGMAISIKRSVPATLNVDGRVRHTRTLAAVVGDLLATEGIVLQGKDYSIPDVETPVVPDMTVQVVRVREEMLTESEGIPFKTVWQPDPNLELDQRAIVVAGKEGTRKRTVRIVYEDGEEVHRFLDREWIDEEPTARVIAFGTKVVVRTMMTPDGPISYWRTLRVWATYYTAATSGKRRDHPQYGITRTGRWATKGIIAVDPVYIRLHTPMYVPGYGFGAAEDTGGLILGMHIDLCFDDDDPNPRHLGWVTIYLLTPVPDPNDIPYIMADYPREPL